MRWEALLKSLELAAVEVSGSGISFLCSTELLPDSVSEGVV